MGNPPSESTAKKEASKSPVQAKTEVPATSDSAIASKTEDTTSKSENNTNAEPLAPPPRPAQPVANTPDYFSGAHAHLSYETNPFEHSFASGSAGSTNGGGGVQTPGGTKLPSVAALTSPAGILAGVTPGFWGGLRSGPLSPAMLSGPAKDDYFTDQHHLRGGFPTPNESGLRSGLTPGGSGSMFPEPSPNTQALFSQLASGGATPTTLDFHRTALSAAAAQKRDLNSTATQPNVTSQPQDLVNGIEVKPPAAPGQFDQHDANDAANGLFLLAQARNGPQPTSHYTIAPQLPIHAQQSMQMAAPTTETSPSMTTRNVNGSVSTASGRGASEVSGGYSDDNEQQARPNTRGKTKRNSTATSTQTNGRRKNEETPAKGSANKKVKGNNGNAVEPDPGSDDEQENGKDDYNNNNKKMTDEEKRKNFLERNRVAALKCRQRKKQWLANLQQKVELFSTENDALQVQLSQLREEVVNLKTLLLAHKDCPVTQQQGLQGMSMHQVMDGYAGPINPYGMAQPMQNQQVIAGHGMQSRRFS
ncbi:bZIP transcription factor [Xylogone sp. PMI_703]|nr:bZIP transcription factor [Xylogone sp. PMI_703]